MLFSLIKFHSRYYFRRLNTKSKLKSHVIYCILFLYFSVDFNNNNIYTKYEYTEW